MSVALMCTIPGFTCPAGGSPSKSDVFLTARMKLFCASTVIALLSISGALVKPSIGTNGAGLVPVS